MSRITTPLSTRKADWTGILSSSLCTVHCVLTPFLLTWQMSVEHLHWMSYLFLSMSFLAVFHISNHSGFRAAQILLWVGFCFLAFGILFEEDFAFAEAANYLGSSLLIIGHIWHLWHCRKQKT